MDASLIGVSTLAITQSFTVFNAFLPPLTDVRRMSPANSSQVMDIRVGEIAAASLVIGIGGALCYMMKTHEPMTFAVLAAVGLIGIYEFALRTN